MGAERLVEGASRHTLKMVQRVSPSRTNACCNSLQSRVIELRWNERHASPLGGRYFNTDQVVMSNRLNPDKMWVILYESEA